MPHVGHGLAIFLTNALDRYSSRFLRARSSFAYLEAAICAALDSFSSCCSCSSIPSHLLPWKQEGLTALSHGSTWCTTICEAKYSIKTGQRGRVRFNPSQEESNTSKIAHRSNHRTAARTHSQYQVPRLIVVSAHKTPHLNSHPQNRVIRVGSHGVSLLVPTEQP